MECLWAGTKEKSGCLRHDSWTETCYILVSGVQSVRQETDVKMRHVDILTKVTKGEFLGENNPFILT